MTRFGSPTSRAAYVDATGEPGSLWWLLDRRLPGRVARTGARPLAVAA